VAEILATNHEHRHSRGHAQDQVGNRPRGDHRVRCRMACG
jgi:hypothetical protein